MGARVLPGVVLLALAAVPGWAGTVGAPGPLHTPDSTSVPNLDPGQPPIRLWILPFQGPGETDLDRVAEAASEILTAFLSRSPEVLVVEREHLDRILAEQGLGGSGLTDPTDRVRMGQLVGATTLITGSLARIQDELVLTSHATEVSSGRILASVQTAGTPAGLEDSFRELSRGLLEGLTTTRPSEEWEVEPHPTGSLHFLRGLTFFHAARYSRALGEFIECDRVGGAGPRTGLWRAKCYLALEEFGHAFLELSLLDPESEGVDRDEVVAELARCIEHISPDELGFYEDLASKKD